MEKIILTEDQLKEITSDDDLQHYVVSQYIGSDDILTVNGINIKNMFLSDVSNSTQNINLSTLLDWYLKDVSGNSFTIITIHDGKMTKVEI